MEKTPCPAVVTVGEPQALGRVRVHCARTDDHTQHTATLFGRERSWTETRGSSPEIRQW